MSFRKAQINEDDLFPLKQGRPAPRPSAQHMTIIQNDKHVEDLRILNEPQTAPALSPMDSRTSIHHWSLLTCWVTYPYLYYGIFISVPTFKSSEDSPTSGKKNTTSEVGPLICFCYWTITQITENLNRRIWRMQKDFRNPIINLIFYIWKKE